MAIHTCLVTFSGVGFCPPNSSYIRPKLEVIGQMSCQVKYLFAALPGKLEKYAWWESNLGPWEYSPNSLPTELRGRSVRVCVISEYFYP
jgi:hypothetical protein